MRRTATRRPIRLTETKLRQIIRSVINESLGQKDPRLDNIKRCLQRYDGRLIDAIDFIGELGVECNGWDEPLSDIAHELIWDALSEHDCFDNDLDDSKVTGKNFDAFMSIDDAVYFVCPEGSELNELAHKIRAACARRDPGDY